MTETLSNAAGFRKFRWFAGWMDDFSWVYGVSEVEIKDFSNRYNSVRQTLLTSIKQTDDRKLSIRLEREFQSLPEMQAEKFAQTENFYFTLFLNEIRFVKKLRMTSEFNTLLDDTRGLAKE
ncbi:MAG: hypothetical protein GC178_10935 [Flavobacteriales bacterium]|nr:hypothetical protein [Flavobacteriales bacterium]